MTGVIMMLAAATVLRFADQIQTKQFDIAPYLSFGGVIGVALIAGGFAVWNRKRNATETKAPTTEEAWNEARRAQAELDLERRYRRNVENLWWTVRSLARTHFLRTGETPTQEELDAMAAEPEIPKPLAGT